MQDETPTISRPGTPGPFRRLFDVAVAGLSGALAVLVGAEQLTPDLGRHATTLRFLAVSVLVFSVLVGYRSISERRAAETAARLEAKTAAQVSKTRDEFLANVSYSLRTPLTGIVGFAHVVKETSRDPAIVGDIDQIIGESAELSRIVDDMITAARVETDSLDLNPEDVSVTTQVAKVLEYMELLKAHVSADCLDATVVIDPERFRQLLRNLVVNAHSHGRGHVRIQGSVRDDRYVLDVVDEGPGLPEDVRQQLFEPFVVRTGSRITGRLGLGLAIVKSLAEKMGCEVSYRRTRGETHFVVSIPLATADTGGSRPRYTSTIERAVRVADRILRVPA